MFDLENRNEVENELNQFIADNLPNTVYKYRILKNEIKNIKNHPLGWFFRYIYKLIRYTIIKYNLGGLPWNE